MYHLQVYRSDLSDFRNTVLPRDFSRSFRENPETTIISDSLNSMNGRYSRLRQDSSQYLHRLEELLSFHQTYNQTSDVVNSWLPGAEKTVETLLNEPIAVEPGQVQQQIDKLEVIR